jgi:hypothetical protein
MMQRQIDGYLLLLLMMMMRIKKHLVVSLDMCKENMFH